MTESKVAETMQKLETEARRKEQKLMKIERFWINFATKKKEKTDERKMKERQVFTKFLLIKKLISNTKKPWINKI